ncbi:hypothetical protein G6F56_008537 [Rhizopus delemar]|nr:hypothetical protein G6F56_008537 [Rhizopus delemar]
MEENPNLNVMSSTLSVNSPAGEAADLTNRGKHNAIESFPAFRGRSKSSAWALDSPQADYFPSSNVPYKARSWEPTLERAIKAIVSIKASHVRSFDSETSGDYTATGSGSNTRIS